MQWRIGTMGFSYGDWRGVFFPAGTKSEEFLSTYARAFDTVELDTTFHAIPPIGRIVKWADKVPDGFAFCVKTPRQITHDAPIATGAGMMKRFAGSLEPMRKRGKCGPILIQFPPSFASDQRANLEAFMAELPQGLRYAVEFRNKSWDVDETGELLRRFNCAWVAADYGVDPWRVRVTADFLYMRFIGVHEQFEVHDRERMDMTERLAWWKGHLEKRAQEAGAHTIYAMFNNDYAGHSPATANRLKQLIGLPTLVPSQSAPQQKLF